MMKPVFYMLVGLPASGKSTYTKSLAEFDNQRSRAAVIHSSDSLREELFGDVNDQPHNDELFVELHRRIRHDLCNGINVIYDATNINKKSRIRFLKSISKIDCTKFCICMATPYEVCVERNSNRARKIPEDVIKSMYMRWAPPYYDEGWDNILIYNAAPLYTFKHYTIKEFLKKADVFDQENHHHNLTLGAHCRKAAEWMTKVLPDCRTRQIAAMIHDNGKLFTKTYQNHRGETDGDCHYYQHENVGAYNALLYGLSAALADDQILYISNLIYYHMRPLRTGGHNTALKHFREKIGDDMFDDVMMLHEADISAN